MMKFTPPSFASGKVLVVGDVMLDKYWVGETKRISPEAPVPIVKIDGCEYKAGGAANVALNVAELGTNVTIVGVTGNDSNANILASTLKNLRITNAIIRVEQVKTITKLRILSNHQQLIRLDFEDPLYSIDKDELTQHIKALIPNHDILLISDYAKGTLSNVEALIQCARDCRVPVLVDPKGKDFIRYHGANIITPNMFELQSIIGVNLHDENLVAKTEKLVNDLALDSILVTRSENGMTLVNKDASHMHWAAKAHEVFDVTGAGDTVISTLAACLAANIDLETACHYANVAAGIVVGKLGTASVTAFELAQAVNVDEHICPKVLTKEQLVSLLNHANQDGREISMLVGDFDIVTAQHVALIRQIVKNTNKLVVNVNEHKGSLNNLGTLINSFDDRIDVMSAIDGVGWITSLSKKETAELSLIYPNLAVVAADED